MGLDPKYIEENLHVIGFKEAKSQLKEIIDNSSDLRLRKSALEVFISIDNDTNFKFFEHLFLSDENKEIRLRSGVILSENYKSDKHLLPLLEFCLYNIKDVDLKFYAIETLNNLDNKKSRKIIKEFLTTYIKLHLKEKKGEFPQEIFSSNNNNPLNWATLETCFNLILHDYYVHECGYNVSLKNGIISALDCEGAKLEKLTEIQGLNKLNKLKYINLKRNNLRNINGIYHLKNLKHLDLTENRIENIEYLEVLESLEELILSSNYIKEIENLVLPNLKELSLDHNNIDEIKNLDNLNNLVLLNLNHNNIKEIKSLENLENLRSLLLTDNVIEKISGLECLRNLRELYLNLNKITRIQGLGELYNLKVLNLSNNAIERLENLSSLMNLTKFELSSNRIKKIEGIEGLSKLKEFFVDKNRIERIEGLQGLENLIILFLENNFITDFKPKDIESLKSLNFIFLNGNPLNEESRKYYHHKTRFP